MDTMHTIISIQITSKKYIIMHIMDTVRKR